MVIQRWQSVYLLIASVMMGFFCYLPMATEGEASICVYQQPVYLTLNILITALSFISIFLFKNLSRQKTVVKVNMFLMLASAITGAIIIYPGTNLSIEWTGAPLLLGAALVITLAAYSRIRADERLLKSYDRIR